MLQPSDKPVYRKIPRRNRISYSQACHSVFGAVEVANNIHCSSTCLFAPQIYGHSFLQNMVTRRIRTIVGGYRSLRETRSAQRYVHDSFGLEESCS